MAGCLNQMRGLRALILCLILLAMQVFSKPKISVEKTDVDMGTIREGSKEKLRYTFVVKNTGDEPLHIKEVKPG